MIVAHFCVWIAALVAYIENNRDGLYGSRSLRGKVKAEKVLVCSTGAMENNVDVVIDRRFKKHGMSWTTEGADSLVQLRIPCYNQDDWEQLDYYLLEEFKW